MINILLDFNRGKSPRWEIEIYYREYGAVDLMEETHRIEGRQS